MLLEWVSTGKQARAHKVRNHYFWYPSNACSKCRIGILQQVLNRWFPMRNYRKLTPVVFVFLVVLTIWLISPVMAGGDPEAARRAWPMIENGALVVDVRSAEEFAGGHLDGAININWDDTNALIKAIGNDKQRQVVFYCRSGNRAGKAIAHLKIGGYTNIYNATGLGALKQTKP